MNPSGLFPEPKVGQTEKDKEKIEDDQGMAGVKGEKRPSEYFSQGATDEDYVSLDYSRNERKKSPLPMWERVGVRGIIQRFPLPPGEGPAFWHNL